MIRHGDDLHAVTARQIDQRLQLLFGKGAVAPGETGQAFIAEGAPEFQNHMGHLEKARQVDGFFDGPELAVREDAEVYGAKGYGRRVVNLGGGDVECFPPLRQLQWADQLNQRLDAVQQGGGIGRGHADAFRADAQRVAIARGKAAVRAADGQAAARAARRDAQFAGVAAETAPQRFRPPDAFWRHAADDGADVRAENESFGLVLGKGFRGGVKMTQIHGVRLPV